jgi:polyferredoxin
LEAHAQGDKAVPDTRIIATVSEDPGRLTKDGRVLAPLAERLAEKTLFMPRLRDRKEDILPLARYFLSRSDQRAGEPKHQFNRSAERLLGSLQYRHGNVAELQEAVEFAAVIAGGAEIGAEHIFTGPKDKGQPVEYDLGQTPLVPWLSRRTVVNVLQTLVLLLFLGIALACLAAGGTLVGQVANGLVWGLWWPALMILFLFVGRVWCPFCPISKVGRIFRAIGGLDRAPPERLKKHTGWIMALLFFAVIWSEHVFGMTGSPAATGILLLTLMACCAAVSVVHSRDAWCRYLCPLGSLSAGYAVASPTHVHSIPSVCGTQCKTQECFKGSASDPGCPMFHHPLYVRDAHFCKVCLTCVRVCPNQSARLYLRPPLQAIWRSGELSPTLIPLCLVASLLALVMLASQRAGWGVDGAIGFTVAGGLVLAVSFTVAAILPRLLSRDGNVGVASRAMLALLLLGWGPLMAFHIANIPGLETLRIHATPDSFWTRLVPSLDLSLVTVLQFGAVLFAAVVGGITLWRIRVHMTRQDAEIVPWGWNAFLAAATVYLTVSICLVILGKPTP